MSESDGRERQVMIVGGGLAGLAAAARFSLQGWRVRLFEKGPRWGGLIGSTRHAQGVIEHAAHALIHTPAVARAAHSAGVELVGARPSARRRYFGSCPIESSDLPGRLSRWPLGPTQSLLVVRGLWRLRKSDMARPRSLESVAEWGERIFGQDFVSQILTPALQGIHAAPAETLHAGAVLTRFFEPATNHRRRERVSPKGSVAPRGGMQDLVDALVRQLEMQGAELHLNRAAKFEDLRSPEKLIVAGSARDAARFFAENDLSRQSSFSQEELADLHLTIESLRKIAMLGLISVTLHRTRKFCDGFGAVFANAHRHGVLGVLQNDSIFDGRIGERGDAASETWILGGFAQDRAWLARSDAEILAEIEQFRRRYRGRASGEQEEILNSEVHRWPEAIPHYNSTIGQGAALWSKPRRRWALTGNYLGHIGAAGFFARAEALEEYWRLQGEGL
ncbi:MAG TPA: FAD-dependent oxidoreductase [Pseudobdellovibrionaceae bacterium]|nr:FAD-dependent oxidoreductase [Pseudobdellovibrionaceae bacterium]